MFQENSQKIIIASLAVFLLASFIFLAYTERQQHQLNADWFLYFENPKSSDLDFVVENYGDDSEFEWSLSADNNLIISEKVIVKNKEKKIIKVSNDDLQGKIKIKVKQKENEKQIYKNKFIETNP